MSARNELRERLRQAEALVDGQPVALYFSDDANTCLRLRVHRNNFSAGNAEARAWLARAAGDKRRWIALDPQHRPCAWPVAPEVTP